MWWWIGGYVGFSFLTLVLIQLFVMVDGNDPEHEADADELKFIALMVVLWPLTLTIAMLVAFYFSATFLAKYMFTFAKTWKKTK